MEPVPKTIAKVQTTVWADKRGIHKKRSLIFLRRRCIGYNVLEEEITDVGRADGLDRVINFDDCKDGIYRVEVCNETTDYDSGYVDYWEYRLVPVKKGE